MKLLRFRNVSASSSPLWSHSLLVIAFMIFMRYLYVRFREFNVALQEWMTASLVSLEWIIHLPGWSSSHFLVTLFDQHGFVSRWTSLPPCRVGVPRDCFREAPSWIKSALSLYSFFPARGKKIPKSWSPVLSIDIFGKDCWIGVCVWSYALQAK